MFGDDCGLERVYLIHYIHAGFLPYVFFYVWGDDCVTQGISTLENEKSYFLECVLYVVADDSKLPRFLPQ